MINKTSKTTRRRKRHFRLRMKIVGTKDRPRLCIFRSNKHIYAQLINDTDSETLLSSSTTQKPLKSELKTTWTKAAAKEVGKQIAKAALEKGYKNIVFDRGGNRYHGKILAFAEGVREGGLKF